MTLERRFCELRFDGDARVVEGVAMRYGDVAVLPWGRERFEARALAGDDVLLNLQHDRARPIARTSGGGLTLVNTDKALTLRAELPETRDADDCLALLRGGVLRGLSVEFRADAERIEGDVRVVERATLHAVAVVDKPAYGDSVAAARDKRTARTRPWL